MRSYAARTRITLIRATATAFYCYLCVAILLLFACGYAARVRIALTHDAAIVSTNVCVRPFYYFLHTTILLARGLLLIDATAVFLLLFCMAFLLLFTYGYTVTVVLLLSSCYCYAATAAFLQL